MRRALLLAIAIAACAPRPSGENADTAGARTDSVVPRGAAGSADSGLVIGKCCPDSDSAIYALIERYERTPENDRAPEVALWAYRTTSGLTTAERIVVRDSASWVALWPRILGTHSPKPRAPAVDFAGEMLIVASMGRRATGGYVIAIDSVAVQNDTLHVLVREQRPGPRCGTTAALSAPVALARVRRSNLPVGFTTRTVVRDCP